MRKGNRSTTGGCSIGDSPEIFPRGIAATLEIKQLVTEDTEARQEVTENAAGGGKAPLCSGAFLSSPLTIPENARGLRRSISIH